MLVVSRWQVESGKAAQSIGLEPWIWGGVVRGGGEGGSTAPALLIAA